MATIRKLLLPLFFVMSTLAFSSFSAIGQAGGNASINISFPDFPQALSERIGIPVFASQIVISVAFMFMWLIPLNATKRGSGFLANLMIGLGIMGFCTAIGWFPYWLLLIICLVVAALWSSKIATRISGSGG